MLSDPAKRGCTVKRVLLRAPKDPFEAVPPVQALRRDTIAGNVGNLVAGASSYKMLSTRDSTVEVGQFRVRADDADKINERYDTFVLPMGNALRPGAEQNLRALTRLIERLRIPVVVLGIGAKCELDGGFDALQPIDETVSAFVRAVLAKGPSIGVRGEYTHAYLAHLGFDETEVIGCPSMFLYGRGHRVANAPEQLGPDARIAFSYSPDLAAIGPITAHNADRYPGLIAVPQGSRELRLMLWGDLPDDRGRQSSIPRYATHPLYREDRMRFFVDPWPWIDFLRQNDFSFGSRLYGSIVSLLAGTPTLLLVHDTRTLEVARHLGIPHRMINEVDPNVDAAELCALADPSEFNAGYASRLETLAGFLDKHELPHAFRPGRTTDWFDQKLERTSFPPPVRTLQAEQPRRRGRLRRAISRKRRSH